MKIERIQDLENYMEDEGFNDYTYSIGKFGVKITEGFGLEFNGQRYVYYYTERGQKTVLHEFNTEAAASKYVFEELKNSKTGRQHCVGFTKSKAKADGLAKELVNREIIYEADVIPYNGVNDPRYRTFVYGRDIKKNRRFGSRK